MVNIIDELFKIIRQNPDLLQHYAVDFYKYDIAYLNQQKEGTKLLWFLRESGTQLMVYDQSWEVKKYVKQIIDIHGDRGKWFLIDIVKDRGEFDKIGFIHPVNITVSDKVEIN